MKTIIHVLGASGSGTTTLGAKIKEKFGYAHLDSDDYYWEKTDPPYTTKRSIANRQLLMNHDINKNHKCVISGSLCSWGDIFIPEFDLVIFIKTSTKIRLERLKKREYQKFGERIMPGGDMYIEHQKFLIWAEKYDTAGLEQRSLLYHQNWLSKLNCQIIEVDGSKSLEQIIMLIDKYIKT